MYQLDRIKRYHERTNLTNKYKKHLEDNYPVFFQEELINVSLKEGKFEFISTSFQANLLDTYSLICGDLVIRSPKCGHSNAIIFKKIGSVIHIMRYEPHGLSTYYEHCELDSLLSNYFQKNQKIKFISPLAYQGTTGPQDFENHSNDQLKGFCMSISFNFIDLYVKESDKLLENVRIFWKDNEIVRLSLVDKKLLEGDVLLKIMTFATWLESLYPDGSEGRITRSYKKEMNEMRMELGDIF